MAGGVEILYTLLLHPEQGILTTQLSTCPSIPTPAWFSSTSFPDSPTTVLTTSDWKYPLTSAFLA